MAEKLNLLKKFTKNFDPYIDEFFIRKKDETKNLSPQIKECINQIEKLTRLGGKRIRPALIYYIYHSLSGRSLQYIQNYCLSIEILHSWALIHDDIMDKAQIRRGEKTTFAYFCKKYKSFDLANSLAILCGDLSISWADELFSLGLKSEKLKKIYSDLKNEVIFGQIMDITKPNKEKDILQMMTYKTAGYTIEKPLLIGALLGGLDGKHLNSLSLIGRKIGLAFQIQDDILGTFGKSDRLGKSVDSDLKEGKMHLLAIKTLMKLKDRDKDYFLSTWGNSSATTVDLVKIKHFMVKSGGLKSCLMYYNRLAKEANLLIRRNSFPSNLESVLLLLIEEILQLKKDNMIWRFTSTK